VHAALSCLLCPFSGSDSLAVLRKDTIGGGMALGREKDCRAEALVLHVASASLYIHVEHFYVRSFLPEQLLGLSVHRKFSQCTQR
jgi:hypothetical protein